MMHEPEEIPRNINPMTRAEKIIVLLFVVCVISWLIAASLGFAGAVGGAIQYRPLVEFFFWIWIISMVLIGVFLIYKKIDGSRIKQRKTKRSKMKRLTAR